MASKSHPVEFVTALELYLEDVDDDRGEDVDDDLDEWRGRPAAVFGGVR